MRDILTKTLSISLFVGLAAIMCGFVGEGSEWEPFGDCSKQAASSCSSGDCSDGKSCKLVTTSSNFNYCMCVKDK